MAFDISNQIYCSDTMSASELAHGFTKLLIDYPTPLPPDLLESQESLEAKPKVTRTLRSKTPQTPALSPGDMVEIYIKHPHHRRGSWSALRPVLEVDYTTGTITVPESRGHRVKAPLEDVRLAITEDGFAQTVREPNDCLDRLIDLALMDDDDDKHHEPYNADASALSNLPSLMTVMTASNMKFTFLLNTEEMMMTASTALL